MSNKPVNSAGSYIFWTQKEIEERGTVYHLRTRKESRVFYVHLVEWSRLVVPPGIGQAGVYASRIVRD